MGDSPYSSSGNGTTNAGVPATPAAPTVTALSSSSLRVTWATPTSNGANITSYDLRYREIGSGALDGRIGS